MATTKRYGGLCACGCGQETQRAPYGNKHLGWKKDEPFEYVSQHHNNKKRRTYVADPKTGCHVWQGQPSQRYPARKVEGRPIHVHKWAWEQANGPIPEGMVLHHTCGNTRCVNVDHLEVATQAENSHHRAGTRLSVAKADRIRRLANLGHSYRDLAEMYGVSIGSIQGVVYGHTWKPVELHRPHPRGRKTIKE